MDDDNPARRAPKFKVGEVVVWLRDVLEEWIEPCYAKITEVIEDIHCQDGYCYHAITRDGEKTRRFGTGWFLKVPYYHHVPDAWDER